MSDKISKTSRCLAILCILFCLTTLFKTKGVFASEKNNVSSGEIVMEVNSKRVLYQKNATDKKFMASTTKILTAIVIIEQCNLLDIVTVKKETTGIEGSSIYLEAGEKLSVKDLLYGLMLRSGNDCAETLAVHCSGSIDKFANLMNETAQKIGATNSNFVNPHGLHDDEHYTTAYDLALISSYAIKNQTFKEIVSTKSIYIPFTTRDYKRYLVNKNKMLTEYEGATGIKTGYTKKAGRCLVTSCVRNGMELVSVVLNCPPMFEQSKNILNVCFDEYKINKILESDYIIDFLDVENSDEKCAIHIKNDIILPLLPNEAKDIKIEYNYPKKLDKNIKNDAEVGSVKIYSQNNLLFEEKIYTIYEE